MSNNLAVESWKLGGGLNKLLETMDIRCKCCNQQRMWGRTTTHNFVRFTLRDLAVGCQKQGEQW